MEIVYSQRNSYAHWQAATANTKTQTWQRMCLPNRTNTNTEVITADKVVNLSSVLQRNFVLNRKESASNPLLHIHSNSCE